MIWKVFQIVLWLAAAAYAVVGVVAITGMLGSAREADSLRYAYMVFGLMFLIIGAVSAFVTFLANKSRAWLIVAPLILCAGLPLALVAAFLDRHGKRGRASTPDRRGDSLRKI